MVVPDTIADEAIKAIVQAAAYRRDRRRSVLRHPRPGELPHRTGEMEKVACPIAARTRQRARAIRESRPVRVVTADD